MRTELAVAVDLSNKINLSKKKYDKIKNINTIILYFVRMEHAAAFNDVDAGAQQIKYNMKKSKHRIK